MEDRSFPEIDKIRFCVVDSEQRAISDLWFIHSHGDSIYVAPQKLGGQLKLSLHPTGRAADGCDCQFGHPRDHADYQAARGFKPMRPLRWTRRATPEVGAIHVLSILFPTDYLGRATQPENDGKPKFGLTAAPAGYAVEAGLFISRQGPDVMEQAFVRMGGLPLTCTDLPNGEFVSLVVRQRPFDDISEELAKLKTIPPTPLSGAPLPGESLEGRALMVGEPPKNGEAFQLVEVGPLTIRRRATS